MIVFVVTCTGYVTYVCCFFFFFKQKTAYEMRISDWSSDVCSSDLTGGDLLARGHHHIVLAQVGEARCIADQLDHRIGHACHGGDHHGNVVAGLDLRLHPPRRAADTVEVGDRGAPEFHHDAGHRPLVPLRFLYDCGVIRPAVAAPARRERPGVNGPARTCCLESGGYPYS